MSSMAAALAALAVTESRGCVASRASTAPAVAPSRTREILRISTPFISGAAQAGTDAGFLKGRGPHRPSARGGAFRFGAGSRELRPEPAELGRGYSVPRACDDSQPPCPRSSVVASLDPRKRNGFATQFVAAWRERSGGVRGFRRGGPSHPVNPLSKVISMSRQLTGGRACTPAPRQSSWNHLVR